MERAQVSYTRNPRTIGKRRFYSLSNIERSAHLVPGTVKGKDFFYINSFIDWDQYNTIYDPEFLTKSHRTAEEIHAQMTGGGHIQISNAKRRKRNRN